MLQNIIVLNANISNLKSKVRQHQKKTKSCLPKKKLINDVFNYIIDPEGHYYGVSKQTLDKTLESFISNKIAAIDSIGGINYKNKNLNYDVFLKAFVESSGGYLSEWDREKNTNTELVIRGLGGGSRKAILHCWETGRTFYAIDTGYFGNSEKLKVWHRITKNNLQNLGPIVERPGDRLSKISDYKYHKRKKGSKILICPPSEKVMMLFGQPTPETWTTQVIKELKKHTDRPIEIRLKPNRTERTNNKTIEAALADDVYCLITYNSIAAIEAIMFGKPAIALGPNAAQLVCNADLSQIESLRFPKKDEMYAFMCHLSYAQFTRDEIADGTAWRIINESS